MSEGVFRICNVLCDTHFAPHSDFIFLQDGKLLMDGRNLALDLTQISLQSLQQLHTLPKLYQMLRRPRKPTHTPTPLNVLAQRNIT